MNKQVEIFLDVLNTTYKVFFGHIIASHDSKRFGDLTNLVTKLNHVTLLRGDTREILYQFYVDTLCSTYIRTRSYGPQISILISDTTFKRIITAYETLSSTRSILVASERFIKETGVRSVVKQASPGRYFGYKWEDIKSFTVDSSINLMGELLIQMQTPAPSMYFITLLDGLIFYKLGNNYLEEVKDRKGWVNPDVARISYREIKKLLDCRNRFLHQLELLKSNNIIEAFGYKNCTVKIMGKEATYTDIQLWLNILTKHIENLPILSKYLQIELDPEKHVDKLKYILFTQQQILLEQLHMSTADLSLFKQILLLLELPIAREHLNDK